MDFNNFIQVAGVIDEKEARLLISAGTKFLGFPLKLPVNKEDLTEEEASKIIKNFTPPTYGILITYLNSADEIINFTKKIGTSILQLHGKIDNDELIKLKNIAPDLIVIKSLIVKDDNCTELKNYIKETENCVDAFITDSHNPQTGADGATGLTHNWEISKALVEFSSKPIILAGGLNEKNIYNAIKFVKPAGVDSHTGLENKNGRKSFSKVKAFIDRANKAFREINTN